MTRVLLAVAGLGLLAWVLAEWRAWRDARALDQAVAQAQAMSEHPAGWSADRGAGRPPVEDRPDYP